MKKQLIFIYPPACGKGTQTIMLSKKLNIPHVDTGSLIREVIKNQTEDGIVAKKIHR
ncbi:MAG: nucleoside monophosphate kinase [Candidatus Melainabacteria bacterium]|nr:MAG: nucleoside monophosphate kinase [Candidatus Melainabacteria bacterium]